jgi:hypothetical protein
MKLSYNASEFLQFSYFFKKIAHMQTEIYKRVTF